MRILKEVCSLPTAPFAEQFVVKYVEAFVAARKRLKLSRDRWGNLLISLKGRRKGAGRWVFTAHMDHPGFVAERMVDERTLEARFRGWVQVDYVRGTAVRFFTGGGEVRGKVVEASASEHDRLDVADLVRVRVEGPVEKGSPGMFDQGTGRLKGKKFCSRAIDDLGGVAGALAMLDELHESPPRVGVAVLLTRAEEEGFIGAIAASIKPELLKKTDRIVAIETSSQQPYAPLGAGAIVRIGDKTSVFNSELSYFLTQQAEALKKADAAFRYVRALMPGGTCEATVYDVYGFTAASICIPLGNYHNMDREKKRIGPEFIDAGDWRSMVKLFVRVAREGHTFEPGHEALKRRIEKRFARLKKHLIG